MCCILVKQFNTLACSWLCMMNGCECLIMLIVLVFIGVWEGWGGNGFSATARYPRESYSRYVADGFIVLKLVIEF